VTDARRRGRRGSEEEEEGVFAVVPTLHKGSAPAMRASVARVAVTPTGKRLSSVVTSLAGSFAQFALNNEGVFLHDPDPEES